MTTPHATATEGKTMPERSIFVFGSNLAGRHGKGAALEAYRRHGAVYGKGVGLYGWSYAIPTKDWKLAALRLEMIDMYVKRFLKFARSQPQLTFNVTAIGCGLANYRPEQIAPMFADAPDNCVLPPEFVAVLEARP